MATFGDPQKRGRKEGMVHCREAAITYGKIRLSTRWRSLENRRERSVKDIEELGALFMAA